jgi:hypothetical protein
MFRELAPYGIKSKGWLLPQAPNLTANIKLEQNTMTNTPAYHNKELVTTIEY